ncbi:cyclic-di-AMP receptor [uncultured Tyzzerella sp.]|uniref:cyclic-di-AMP receptor n=1 Tax=uncultured Tyzzerella sp. TaxID=2321398 RepID=UPI002942455E|nr:cyclic-di-AMP receptor [uncultured Tyzzerella sp.]
MKLVMAIVKDDDSFNIMNALNLKGLSVTKLASTGGFLKVGNTTLICGVDDEKVDYVIDIIKKEGHSKKQFTNGVNIPGDNYTQPPIEVTVGGATIFVVDVDKFVKV